MQTPNDAEDYDLRDEYDLSQMTVVPKGRFAPGRRQGKNVVVLAPDVAEAFPSDDAVNEAEIAHGPADRIDELRRHLGLVIEQGGVRLEPAAVAGKACRAHRVV